MAATSIGFRVICNTSVGNPLKAETLLIIIVFHYLLELESQGNLCYIDNMLFWILMILVYSVGGFLFMRDYYKKCIQAEVIPFNGSILKFLLFSFFLGVFTAWTCVCSFCVVFWRIFCEICKK